MKHFGFGVAYGNDPNISYGCYHKAEPVQQMCDRLNENVEEASEAQYRPVELFFNEAAPTPYKPIAWYFRFNNGERRITWDKLEAADIRKHLEIDESETPLYLRPADDKLRQIMFVSKENEMKLPEGRPTEEMIQAGAKVAESYDKYVKGMPEYRVIAKEILEAALAAAPTQPAQEDGNWINADEVNALVRQLDVLLNGAEGAARQASLCDIVAQVAKMKAQEDEPVAWMYTPNEQEDGVVWSIPILSLGRLPKTEVWIEQQLYIRPADDKLRKAVEEFLKVYDTDTEDISVYDLRAALEGKS